MCKLTVITINFNNKIGLEKTITSVVGQTFLELEYILIDGGSNDGSIDVIKQYENNITYWISEPDKGIYDAMNKGISASKGEYICFLNSGDIYSGNYALDVVMREIKNSKAKLFFGNYIFVNSIDDSSILVKIPKVKYKSDLLIQCFGHPATFYDRQLFTEVGFFNINNKIVSDVEWFLKAIIIKKISFFQIDFSPSVFFDDGISSNSLDLVSKEYKIMIKKYYTNFELQFYGGRTFKTLLKITFFKFIIDKIFKIRLNK